MMKTLLATRRMHAHVNDVHCDPLDNEPAIMTVDTIEDSNHNDMPQPTTTEPMQVEELNIAVEKDTKSDSIVTVVENNIEHEQVNDMNTRNITSAARSISAHVDEQLTTSASPIIKPRERYFTTRS